MTFREKLEKEINKKEQEWKDATGDAQLQSILTGFIRGLQLALKLLDEEPAPKFKIGNKVETSNALLGKVGVIVSPPFKLPKSKDTWYTILLDVSIGREEAGLLHMFHCVTAAEDQLRRQPKGAQDENEDTK